MNRFAFGGVGQLLSAAMAAVCFCVSPAWGQCVGDCNDDGFVEIDELLVGVGIALGEQEPDACFAFDGDFSGDVTISELVAAVNNAISDCRGSPPPTPVPDPVLGGAPGYFRYGDVRKTNSELANAVAKFPDDPSANLYYALTRVFTRFFDDSRLKDLLRRTGITVRGGSGNVCELEFNPPHPFPDNAPRSGEMIAAMQEVMGPEIQAALENLQAIPADVNIRFDLKNLPNCFCPPIDVDIAEIDLADVKAVESGLRTLAAVLDLLGAYDLDADSKLAVDGTHREVLEGNSNLLTLRSAAALGSGRAGLDQALSLASQVIDLIRKETDDQSDDVLIIRPEDADGAAKLQRIIDLVRQSLHGEVTVPVDVVTGEVVLMDIGLLGQERLNLDLLFSGGFASLRQFLPAFNAKGMLDSTRFPDPTFGGMTPDLTQDKINRFFSESHYKISTPDECSN